ncbi:MAG: hypothetical protein LBE91_05615 [Tannerella sp.]|jgi:hypothetical protein|nr:hypothetical protein [Tannerella sp.]
MNKYTKILIIFTIFAASCGNEKEAKSLFDQAKSLYEDKQFAAAKNVLDSINILYPKEIEVRKSALTLMRQVERGESEQNIAYCDSLLPIREKELDTLKKGFIFEKDTAYNEIGNYIPPAMTVERNTERSYIRCGVNEEGEMYVASVYFGGRPLEHTGLKLSAANGTYAETPAIAYDGGVNYRFTDNGNTTEVVTYKGTNCKSIMDFIHVNIKERIKAEYTGGKPFSLTISENDKKAIQSTYELALVLSEINALKKEKARSEKRILMIDGKLKKEPSQ